MKTILVTGANGQLGNELRCIENQFPGFHFIFTDVDELNLVQGEEIEAFFKIHPIDFVINCAAYTAVDRAEVDISFAHSVNVEAVRRLAEVCKAWHTQLIHISTDYVFDGRACTPYKEDDTRNPQSVYGFTKLNGEKALEASGARYMIIRTSWLYSSFGSNFLKTMLRLGKERSSIGVVFDQVGCPTYAGDLARAILLIISQLVEKDQIVAGVYHYSNEGVCSWYDFAVEIMKMAGFPCKVLPIETKDYPLPASRPAFSVFNKSKIKSSFGFEIPHWRESLICCYKKL